MAITEGLFRVTGIRVLSSWPDQDRPGGCLPEVRPGRPRGLGLSRSESLGRPIGKPPPVAGSRPAGSGRALPRSDPGLRTPGVTPRGRATPQPIELALYLRV